MSPPDEKAPAASRLDAFPVISNDPITVNFSEPVHPDSLLIDLTQQGGQEVVHTLSLIMDDVTGFVLSVVARPNGLWRDEGALTLAIRGEDGEGHTFQDILVVEVAPTPETSSNMDFERGDEAWIWRGPPTPSAYRVVDAATFYDSEGEQVRVPAPQGRLMAFLNSESHINGYFVPPDGATHIEFEIAVETPRLSTLQQNGRGMHIDLLTPEGVEKSLNAGDLPAVSPDERWTGFSTIRMALPSSSRDGFWLRIRSGRWEPPVFYPKVYVDDFRFSP